MYTERASCLAGAYNFIGLVSPSPNNVFAQDPHLGSLCYSMDYGKDSEYERSGVDD